MPKAGAVSFHTLVAERNFAQLALWLTPQGEQLTVHQGPPDDARIPRRVRRRRGSVRKPSGALWVGPGSPFASPFLVERAASGVWVLPKDLPSHVSRTDSRTIVRFGRKVPGWSVWASDVGPVLASFTDQDKTEAQRFAVQRFQKWLATPTARVPAPTRDRHAHIHNRLSALRGLDLSCWCPLTDQDGAPFPCHANVLMGLANGDALVDL